MGRERVWVNKLILVFKGRVELVYDSCVCVKRCDRDFFSIIVDFIDIVIFVVIYSWECEKNFFCLEY